MVGELEETELGRGGEEFIEEGRVGPVREGDDRGRRGRWGASSRGGEGRREAVEDP